MTLPVFWLPEADAELKQARNWYNNVRIELGERFALAVEAAVESMRNSFPLFTGAFDARGCGDFLTEYSSRLRNQQSYVLACFHGRRDPRHWQKRQ